MKNKVLFIILLFAAIPLYLWDTHTLLSGIFSHKKIKPKQEAVSFKDDVPLVLSVPHFVIKGRSPFSAHKETTQPAIKQTAAAKAKTAPVAAPVNPPKVTITGIMWHPTNPIAMITLPDGSSSAVKANQTIGTILIKTIEKSRVLIVFEGKEFWIAK